ncbi:universal stress protein [Streptomyces aurantiogriseus]|uniref:Universal stress protein n=1 Tax=Streptomyces aurantiogriseus TaxID=66870 RepID=A0A918FFQ3_9ACTN|nr:universal stress protein [Streptomyces aurantiogriseus]GGR35112.1 universal stress protein [Streptomyces aurantiogriseus]
MLSPIVVGLDGSPESRAAADWAAREARRRGLPLSLVTAWIWRPVDVPSAQESEAQKQWAQQLLNEARQDLVAKYPDLPVTVGQVSGLATRALLERAEGAEMLVLGSRGHGAIAGFLLGSVGQHVLAHTNVPVVLVRAKDRSAADGAEPDSGEVVVGIQDRDKPSEELLEFAFSAAAARGATLRAVHAWSRPPVFGYNPAALRIGDDDGGWEARVEQELSDSLKPWQKRYPQVKVVQTIDLASAAEVVLQAARNAGLVVVGRETHRPALGMRIGPVTHGVIHHAAAPVAVVPHD